MMRALYTAASGMLAQQLNTDVIANNLSNVSTTGYKTSKTHFKDLIYQTSRLAGSPATEETVRPLPVSVGNGTAVSATSLNFRQGALQETGVKTDMAIEGSGFFRVLLADGRFAYTRDGTFQVDANNQLVTSQGYRLFPNVILPQEASLEDLSISRQGLVTIKIDEEFLGLTQLQLFDFPNAKGLITHGDNVFLPSDGSGDAVGNFPGVLGLGIVRSGFLENSNVSIAKEMVEMIVAQRAYEINSKAIQTSDSMLGIAVNLKRS